MRLLLDTHAFLWWLDGDRRLPMGVRRQVASAQNTIIVSAASAWEITTKWRIGKLPGADFFGSHLPAAQCRFGRGSEQRQLDPVPCAKI